MSVIAKRRGLVPTALTLAAACALMSACSKNDSAESAAAPTAQQTAAAPTPETVVASSISAMSVDQLREAANKAYNDNRLYAPAGNNAMEYFLALRDKQPGDAAASSALGDLLPMVVSATEQSVEREDYDEAKRLVALVGKADPNHPALSRLKATVASKETQAKQREETQKLTAEEEAKRKADLAKQREEDQKRLQEQQRQQAAQLAQQQEAAQREAALREQADRDAAQRAAAQREAAQREAAQKAEATPAPRPAAASNELRVISSPSPRFPPQAQRAGAGASVQVEFTVGTNGLVTSARVVSIDSQRQFQRDFEREALAAVKRWQFQPIGQSTTTRRTIEFK